MPPHGAYLYLDAGQGMDKPLKPWGWFYYSPDTTLCQRIYNVMQPDLYEEGGLLYIFTSDELGDDWIRADDAIELMGDPEFHHQDLYDRADSIARRLNTSDTDKRISSIGRTSAATRSTDRRALHSILCYSDSEDCEDWTGFASIETPVVAQAISMYLQRRYGKSDQMNFRVVNPNQVALWLTAQDQVEEAEDSFLAFRQQEMYRSDVEVQMRAVDEDYLAYTPHEIDEEASGSLKYHMAAMRKLAVLATLDEVHLRDTLHQVLGGFDTSDDDSEEEDQSHIPEDSEEDLDSDTKTTADLSECSHAEDFSWVVWFGQQYTFAKGHQAIAVQELWRAWEASGRRDGCGLSEKTIGARCGSSSDNFRLSHTFRKHKAFGTMIRSCKKGTFALFSPKSQENHAS